MQTEQEPPKHRKANGLHDDVMNLKVDVAILKEQGRNFATKEDIAKLETQIAQAQAENNENIARLETKIAEVQAENRQAMAAMDNKIEKTKNEMLEAFNRVAARVIVVLVSVMVALLGMVATALF